jgi:hypothetical protein
MDGLDAGLIGVGEQAGGKVMLAVYSERKILEALRINNSWDADEAMEWYEFNIECAYMGDDTPLIIKDNEDAVTGISEDGDLQND